MTLPWTVNTRMCTVNVPRGRPFMTIGALTFLSPFRLASTLSRKVIFAERNLTPPKRWMWTVRERRLAHARTFSPSTPCWGVTGAWVGAAVDAAAPLLPLLPVTMTVGVVGVVGVVVPPHT